MDKRGPKPYRPGMGRPMPIRIIAQQLGVSERTVKRDLESAIRKMRQASRRYVEVA